MIKVYLHKLIRYFMPVYRKSYFTKKVKMHRTAQVVSEELFEVGEYAYIGPNCFINAESMHILVQTVLLMLRVVLNWVQARFLHQKS